MRTGGERITTGTWNWGDRASTYLGPKQKIHVHCTMLLNHTQPRSPPPYCFCKLQAVFSRWKLSGFQMYKGARCFVQQPQNHDAWIHWYCWRFLRQCWNVKVPSYALIRAYVTCMVNVFFHINHVSHTLFINHWKSTWLLYHFHKYSLYSPSYK